jgi:hypothetical protein
VPRPITDVRRGTAVLGESGSCQEAEGQCRGKSGGNGRSKTKGHDSTRTVGPGSDLRQIAMRGDPNVVRRQIA